MADPTKTIPIEGEDTEVVDEGNRSILMGIISQLSKGGDLHRVTLPTFVLESRSMLERITDFMSHPELIIKYVPQLSSDCSPTTIIFVRDEDSMAKGQRTSLHNENAALATKADSMKT